jgi:hypothetical protein
MNEIKSAWEIAQEKIKNITIDKVAMQAQENVIAGKKIASRFLDDPERTSLADELKGLSGEKKTQVKKGILEALLSNLTLPLTDIATLRNDRVRQALPVLVPGSKNLTHILGQIKQFFAQYTEERERLEENLEAQYAPRLRQKAEALAKQMGGRVELKAMQDPEYVALLRKNLALFDERYSEAVREVKKEIERLMLETA